MFYLFDICLGFCGLLVCAVYAYIKHAHSGSRLFHQFLGIVWVVVTYIVSIWVEAVWNILDLSSTLRCYLCLGVGMCWGTGFCLLLLFLLKISKTFYLCKIEKKISSKNFTFFFVFY